MKEVFDKIIEQLEDKRKTAEQLIMENPQDELDKIQTQAAEDFASAYKDTIEIVKQEAEKLGTDTNVGSNRMKNFNGTCYGTCYKCICQECEGNCAMNCLIDSKPEKIAQMTNDEEYVVCCSKFKQIDVSEKKYPCSKCDSVTNDLFEPKKQTNADRIRSMSDEELAEFIKGLSEHCLAGIGACDCSGVNMQPCYEVCGKMARKWLQSEVEE